MIKVKDINGSTIKLEVRSFSYQGNFMGESYISFDVNSPVCINFEIGDYIEYRGERFVLNYIPSPIKNGTPGKSGDAFEYRDVKFNSLADELTRCDFLDVVLSDNHVHFTSLSKFSFYAATVKDLADRIQANLNRLYNGGEAWTVTVEEDVAVKDKSLSVDNINCWEALSLVNSDFDANFVISGRTIRIGTAGISVGTVFGYGKGNGLINIEQSTNNDSLIVTRLRAYGSTRNIPYRYYNNLKDSNGTPLIPESMYVNTLMLPGFAENGGDAYVDSPNITRIGIREKSVYFDGSGGLPEIYPSIEGMTAEELKAAGINVNATGRIDEIVSAEQMTDDGIVPEDKEELDKKTFTITLKDIGFNPVDKKHLTTETPFISMKTGMCGGREFEITGCEEKGNNYVLTCNREMDSSINKAFPNNPYQVSAGDQFVFIGIAMDDIYIKAAEQRLLTAAKDYLSNNDKSKYTYLPKIDKVFMARHPEIASSLKEGNILDFKDTDLGIDASVIIQSLVIKEGGPVPEYEITLFNDKVVSTIEKIQNSITSLASNTGITIEQAKSLFATWVEAWRVKWFDQKLHTYDPVEFNSVTSPLFVFNEPTTPEFVSGLLGAGTRLKDNHLELDEITVRKRMNVFELLIQRVRAVGGQLLLSPASIKIESVEELEDGYKCSFNTDDRTIPEPFVLNDQAFHQTFTGKGINRYWRLTTGAGDDYFILSKTDCEPGSGIPRPGDEVILLGNRTDKARQSAMMLSAYGNDAPYLDTYDGINDYNLSGKLLTREGNLTGIVDEVFGQLSGSGFYGKNVFLRGRFAFNSGQDVEEVLEEVKITANEARDYITNTLPTLFEEVDARIDGQVESFFENYDPTLTNRPASSWTTDIEKERHLNDTFTNNNTGASWKWVKDGNAYKWIEIADVATVKALAIAGKAQETADGKIRNFITTAEHPTPYPPYDVGDLWNQGDGGDIMCCIASRASGNYVAADWVKSNKYTDDAVAIDARNKANEARSSAEIAKTSAEEANAAISDMSSDDIISPIEKQALKKEWDAIMSEKSFNDAQADKFNVSRTLYDGAYNDLATFIGGNLSNLTTNWNVSGSTLRFTFKTYYDARTTLLNNIAYVAKQQAEKAESDAANAQNAADNAISGLVEANKQITSLDGKYTAQQSDITNLKTTVDAIPGKITQEVSGVIDWTKQYTRDEIGNLQIGMVNLLKGSNVELNAQAYNMGRYYFDKKLETGKTYTLVVCYTLAEATDYIVVFQDSGYFNILPVFESRGSKVVESRTFTYTTTHDDGFMTFYQFPNGAYGSKVHWAVLVEGNKGPNSWIPSQADNDAKAQAIAKAEAELAETKANAYADGIVTEAEQNAINEAQARLDALKIGSVNLVSRKMMLAWNEKNKDIAVWGQDSDGIYLSINPALLYNNTGNGTEDIFLGENKYKANTQYVFSIDWKTSTTESTDKVGLTVYVAYTDGSSASLLRASNQQTTKKRTDYITEKGKTIRKIFNSYGYGINCRIYSLALYEANKVLAEPPVATEDLTGQSNVNLVDGGKEVTIAVSSTDTWNYKKLIVPRLKPNTVYYLSFKVENLTGSPTVYSAILSDKGITTTYSRLDSASGGVMITPNTFTEGEARLLLYAGKAGATVGNSVKYTEVMLVEGFTPPASYSPSPGDVQKEIDDVSNAVSNLDTTINTTFKDGIISEAEAQAIASNINVLNAEKADIDAYYTKLYANAYLTGTAKTNLASAKTAYNTAHTNLINSINTAIADGKTTATEKADVDAKFSAYNNALSAYQTRVGEADKAIQDTIKKVADDAQTSANTAQSAANTAQSAANAAQSAANQAQADANAANSKLATWASDNYISPQEKTALRQQKSDIQSEQKDIEANANRYVISLASYMAAYNAAIDALNKYTATSPENIAVESDYNNISAYYTARQTILNSIAAAAKAQADKATWAIGMDGGKMLYDDPEFKKGLNGTRTYGAQNGGGTVVISRTKKSTGQNQAGSLTSTEAAQIKEKLAGSPYSESDWCLYIKCHGGTSTGHLGGFYFGNQSRANAVFIVKVSAKIPVGYTLKNAHNSHGAGWKQEFLTPMVGTGKYETYIFKETCGSMGTFSTINHLCLSGPVKPDSDPLEWFVDYATVFDLTADGYGDIVEIAKTETVAGINNNPDSVTVYAKKTDFNSLNQVVNQQGSQLQVNTNSIDAIVTKNGSGTIVSIKPEMVEITGATVIQDGNGNKVNIFGIGDKVISVNGGVFSVDKAGKVIMQNAEIAGKITAKTGQIGDFTIDGIWLKGSQLRISGSQITFENGNNQVYLNSHPDMTTGGAVKLGTFVLTGGSYNGLESARAVALIAAAPSDNYSCAIAVTSGRVLMKGQIHFDNVVTYTGSGAVTITADSGHFIYLTPITGNPVVSVSSGLPIGSWFIIAHATTAGGFYYIKLSGSDRFRRRGNAYQQVNSNNQDPSLLSLIHI